MKLHNKEREESRKIEELSAQVKNSIDALHKRDEIIEQLNKTKTELQDQCIRLEEKNQIISTETQLFKRRYTDTLKHTQEINNENDQIQMEIQRFKEKNRVIEEYQNKVDQLEKQLRVKQEELEAGRKQIENMSRMLEAEEIKREYLLNEKQEEMQKLQELIYQNKGNSASYEEKISTIESLEKKLGEMEEVLKKARVDYEKLIIEKEELNTYVELLDAKVRKKDTDSSFLVLIYL